MSSNNNSCILPKSIKKLEELSKLVKIHNLYDNERSKPVYKCDQNFYSHAFWVKMSENQQKIAEKRQNHSKISKNVKN